MQRYLDNDYDLLLIEKGNSITQDIMRKYILAWIVSSRYWMDSSVCLFQHMFLHILWGSLSLDSQQCYKQTKNNNVILINVKRFVIACIWSVSEVYYLPFVHFSKISGENLCTIMIRKYHNHHSSDVKSL